MSDFFRDGRGDLLIARKVASDHLDVVRSGQPKVNGLAHNIGREEIEDNARKLLVKAKSQLPYVACRRLVALLQSDRDVRIGGPADAAIAVREIYARYG